MGLTVLDAGVLIGLLDADDLHHAAARRALEAALDRSDRLAMPASAYAEGLVGPARRGEGAKAILDELVERLPIHIAALDQLTAATAARLRAAHGSRLKLPDALVVAAAITLDADVLVTTDRRWPARGALGLTGKLVEI